MMSLLLSLVTFSFAEHASAIRGGPRMLWREWWYCPSEVLEPAPGLQVRKFGASSLLCDCHVHLVEFHRSHARGPITPPWDFLLLEVGSTDSSLSAAMLPCLRYFSTICEPRSHATSKREAPTFVERSSQW